MSKNSVLAGTTMLAAASFLPEASASEIEVGVASSYVDTATFNERFSEEPVLKLTGTFDLGEQSYVQIYGYTGFEDPFQDESSEYGFEIGTSFETGENSSLTLAGGRWMNYAGQGPETGDWFVSARLESHGFQVGATALFGETDTIIVSGSYEAEIGERFTVSPTVSYNTETERFNPGLVAEYALTDSVSIAVQAVYPEDAEGEREVYAAGSLVWRF